MDFKCALTKNIYVLSYSYGGLKFLDIQLIVIISLFSKVIIWFRSLRNILAQLSLEIIDVSIFFNNNISYRYTNAIMHIMQEQW